MARSIISAFRKVEKMNDLVALAYQSVLGESENTLYLELLKLVVIANSWVFFLESEGVSRTLKSDEKMVLRCLNQLRQRGLVYNVGGVGSKVSGSWVLVPALKDYIVNLSDEGEFYK